ncbi:hypothetical protein DM82_1805 [Burkholderia oklahomensis]|uniref:Uncharacterized protein n=1 Tax=Burkholderia oklahomensis TaxID=342113 RepID=A0AAI8FN50_9BURK|nr:hypothetical protein DM82_1805 [Burkholderia oklahomensis]AJX32000.1 hypothetical protein BG90_2914 [Burkholderia oklahomensis C6786]SUW56339.1 Uncharacterised protein [Burkholderia oklahomensis]
MSDARRAAAKRPGDSRAAGIAFHRLGRRAGPTPSHGDRAACAQNRGPEQ